MVQTRQPAVVVRKKDFNFLKPGKEALLGPLDLPSKAA
jgi:hypothetical protein